MGTKYCKPVRSTPDLLEVLHGMPMLEVRTKYHIMTKLHNKKGYYFFTSKEIKQLFDLSDEQMYFVVSTFTSNQDVIRVGSIDFWCALALSASGASNDKISFGFKLIDTNNDDYISYNELIVLFICATRGVARFKGLTFVPENLIDRIAMRAFQVYQKDLNENGELAMKDLIEYLLTNENCRAYLAGLGAKLPPVDSAAMVLKRAHILRELAQVRFQMDDVVCDLEDAKDNYDVTKERGGDVELLRIGGDAKPSTNVQQSAVPLPPATTNIPNKIDDRVKSTAKVETKQSINLFTEKGLESTNTELLVSMSSPALLHTIPEDDEFETIKESLGKDHPVNKYFGYDDSWMGEIYNKPRPYLDKKACQKEKRITSSTGGSSLEHDNSNERHVNIFGKSFEDLLLKEWRKIPQEDDLMVELDEFTLMALFQQLNVNITFYFARKCLTTLPKSQLCKYNFHDVLKWFRKNYIEHELDRDPHKNNTIFTNAWFEYIRQWKDGFDNMNQSYSNFIRFISRQRKIVKGLTNTAEVSFAKKLADFRAMSLKKPSIAEFKYTFNKSNKGDESDDISDTSKKSILQAISGKNPVQPTSGTRLKIQISTNPFTNLSTKRPKDSTRMKIINEDGREFILIKDPQGFDANDVLDFYNLCAEKEWLQKIQAAKQANNQESDSLSNGQQSFTKPPLSRNSSFYSSGYGSISKSSKNLLDDHDPKVEKEEDKGPIEYKSAVWFGVDLRKDVDHAYAILLREAIHAFFESIPLTYRKHIYTTVFTEICCLEPSAEELGKKRKRKSAMDNLIAAVLGKQDEESMWAMGKRVVLVVLLHEEDHFLKVEQSLLEADLFFSRFLQHFSIQLDLQQSLQEIFAYSMKYFHFEEKLFGPQEDELGEEGSNPLRFAKEIRTQKKNYKDILDKVKTLSRDELQQYCREYGRTDQGTNAQLIERVKEIISERLELIGFGELSQYGKDMIRQVYERLKGKPRFPANGAESINSTINKQYDESGFKLWEFNEFLYQSNSKTLYDNDSYHDLLQEYSMLLDRNQNMKIESLFAYYEKFGKLQDDVLSWGIVNLDSFLSGQISGSAVFDTEALFSITQLISKSSTDHGLVLNLPQCYQLLGKITSLKELKIDGDLKKLSDFISLIPWQTLGLEEVRQKLMMGLAKPGGFVEVLMDIMARWCDGESGILPILRQYVTKWKATHAQEAGASSKASLSSLPQAVDHEDKTDLQINEKEPNSLPNTNSTDEMEIEKVENGNEADTETQKKPWIVFDDTFKNAFLQEVQAKIEIAMKDEEELKKMKEAERLAEEEKAAEEAAAQRIRFEQGHGPTPAELAAAPLTKQQIEELKAKEKEEKDAAMKREYDIKNAVTREVARKFLHFDFRTVSNPETVDISQKGSVYTNENENDNVSALSGLASRDHDEEDMKTTSSGPHNIIPIKHNEDWKALRQKIVEELLFLHSIRQMNNIAVSLDESIAIESMKKHHLELLQHLHILEYDHYERLSCQFLAVYDGLRLFSTGLSIVGLGTRDFCCRSQLAYNFSKDFAKNNMMEWLPVGLGEMVHVKEVLKEKRARFERRRIGALAALERERLRRQMTEEDHERLRLQKLEALRAEYEKEEKLLFDHALSLLMNSRESRKNTQELNVLVKAFEKICLLKEKRFPDDYGVNVARNNLACVLVEVYGLEHPLAEPVEFYFKDAVERIMAQHQNLITQEKEKIFKEYQESRKPKGHQLAEYFQASGENIPSSDQSSIAGNSLDTSTIATQSGAPDLANQQEEEEMTVNDFVVDVPISNPSTSAMIIINYIDVLFKNESTTALRQIFPVKEYFAKCYESMSPKEQETIMISVVPEYRNIPVFGTNKKPETIIKNMLQEVAYFSAKKKAEEESLRSQLESLASSSVDKDEESVASTVETESTAKRIGKKNREKQQKSLEQRQKDNKVRMETARQRKFLYELIQTDQISKIFAAKAGNVETGGKKWVSAEDQDLVQNASQEFATMVKKN